MLYNISMSSSSAVAVRTAPSTFINADLGTTNRPYRRILAVETTPGQYASCPDIELYGSVALATEVLNFPDEAMAGRFVTYFTQIIVRNDPHIPNYWDRPEADYSCHDFVDVLTNGVKPQGRRTAARRAQALIDTYQPTSGPLDSGHRGILVRKSHRLALHSLVGIGKECLNVLADGGTVGITSYDDLLNDYQQSGGAVDLLAARTSH